MNGALKFPLIQEFGQSTVGSGVRGLPMVGRGVVVAHRTS